MRAFNWTFVAEPQAVQAARHRVDELDLEPPAHRRVSLLVSELVTNSIRHGNGGSIGLAVELDERVARVAVLDGGHGFAPPPAPRRGEPRPSGWGLYLVERLADRWGVGDDGRTRVWFEVARR